MATTGSKLQTREMQFMSNMTEQSHLGMALLAKPTQLMGVMDQIFTSQSYYSQNPLSKVLMGTTMGEETVGGTSWTWDLKGANTRPLVIIENVVNSAITQPGKYLRPFKIKLDEDWFVPGDVLHPGTSNKKNQVRVVKQVEPDGDGFLYEVVLMTKDKEYSLPVKYLKVGQQWAKLYSVYEEGSDQAGSTQFSLPITFENKMSKFKKKYMITDYASTEVLAVKVQDTKGKSHDSWMRYAEVEYWQQWYRELERGFWYSRSTDSVMGANNRPVRSGPGLQEQLEDSHIHRYSHLSARLIEEYLMDIFYSTTAPGKGRHIKGYTGEYGMIQFHRAIQSWVDKGGFIKNVETYVRGVKSDFHENAIGAGYQYTKYSMANGAVLELIHNPLYDDREINFEIDEITGFPMESQRITFLDFSGESAKKSNIKIMNKKDGETFVYVNGSHGPTGPTNGNAAHDGDYYEMTVGKSCGIHVHDVTKCGELILTRG